MTADNATGLVVKVETADQRTMNAAWTKAFAKRYGQQIAVAVKHHLNPGNTVRPI